MNAFPSKSVSDNRKSKTCPEPCRRIQNRKWLGLSVFAFVLVVAGAAAQAQQPKKVYRIGYLMPGDPTSESADSDAVRLALHELGYIEGQNIAFEYRYADGRRDRYPELAADLVRLKVDIIVVSGGNTPVRAVRNATRAIPVVMASGSNPVQAGLVESLARPGGNVTGLTNLRRELGGKRLELLKEAVPKLDRVAVLYYPANPNSIREAKEVLPSAGRTLGLTIQPWEVRDADGFDKVFAAFNKQRPDGLYVPGGTLVTTNQRRIVSLASKSRLPAMYNSRDAVDAGGLMYYGADLSDSDRRVAITWTRSSKEQSPQICLSSSRANSS